MSNLVLSVRKTLNKIIVGTSRIFYSFDKNISGVKKSRVTNVPNYEKDINFQIFYPTNFAEKKLPTLYYFHGGGWIEYDKTIYNTLCKRFAKMGNIVVNVDYPLAPKYKMQELLEGCINIINFAQCITKEHFNADNDIIIGGDSAGAQIAGLFGGLEATGKFGDLFNKYTLPKISALLLFYGVYDFENVLETKFPSIELMLDAVFNKDNKKEEYYKYSPINYINKNFPPCFIASGERDKLHKLQTMQFVKKLEEAGAKSKVVYFDKSEIFGLHGFMAFDDFSTNKKVRVAVKEFLSERTKEENANELI